MTRIRFLSRALDLVLRRRRDQRLSEEIETHLDLLAAEQMTLGLNEEEARRAARRAFGGVARIKERCPGPAWTPLVDTTLQICGWRSGCCGARPVSRSLPLPSSHSELASTTCSSRS